MAAGVAMRTCFREVIAIALSLSILAVGCTKTHIAMVGRCEGSTGQSLATVVERGTYTARWAAKADSDLQPVIDSGRIAEQGDRLGFQRFADGRLIGIHNDNQIPLAGAPASAAYVVWYRERTTSTQFGREMKKAGDGTKEVAHYVVAGTVAVVVGVALLVLWVTTSGK